MRSALLYLCIVHHRISPRWRAIPAACNLPLARPPRAPAPTISFLQIHHLLHSLDNNQAFNICCTHVFWFLNIYIQFQCDSLTGTNLTLDLVSFIFKFFHNITCCNWQSQDFKFYIFQAKNWLNGVFYGYKLVSLWDWSTLDLTFWDGRSFNSVICPEEIVEGA